MLKPFQLQTFLNETKVLTASPICLVARAQKEWKFPRTNLAAFQDLQDLTCTDQRNNRRQPQSIDLQRGRLVPKDCPINRNINSIFLCLDRARSTMLRGVTALNYAAVLYSYAVTAIYRIYCTIKNYAAYNNSNPYAIFSSSQSSIVLEVGEVHLSVPTKRIKNSSHRLLYSPLCVHEGNITIPTNRIFYIHKHPADDNVFPLCFLIPTDLAALFHSTHYPATRP